MHLNKSTKNRSDLVVVGGSQEEHVYNLNTDSCDQILARCQTKFPCLKVCH